jgi:hypothetical protein
MRTIHRRSSSKRHLWECDLSFRGSCALAFLAFASLNCSRPPSSPPATPAKNATLGEVLFQPVSGAEPAQSKAQVRTVTLVLLNPDDPQHPSAWEGPLKVEGSGAGVSCSADVSLVSKVFSTSDGTLLVVLSHSGSLTYLQFIRTASCQEAFPRIQAFAEGVVVTGDEIKLMPACVCDAPQHPNKPCLCDSAKVYNIGEGYRPVFQASKSLELTRSVLGVGFEGRRKVIGPKTPAAKLAE